MKHLSIIAVWLLSFGMASGWSSPVIAGTKADIVNVVLSNGGDHLEVSFRVANCFNTKMEEAILSGVPTTFRVRVVVERPGFSVLKPPLLDQIVERTIKYDLLRNEFTVELSDHPERVRVTGNFDEAKRWMSSVKDLRLIPVSTLTRGETYQVRLKAELSKIELPFFFRYVFFFVSLWDFETDWRLETFTL